MFKDLLVQCGLTVFEASSLMFPVKDELEQDYDNFDCSDEEYFERFGQ